jgi:hypothetical protein
LHFLRLVMLLQWLMAAPHLLPPIPGTPNEQALHSNHRP